MLLSKSRPIVFTQVEHARLAGTLAFLWGNRQFALPPVGYESFVAGVTFHDRGYGQLDSTPIPEANEDSWLQHQIIGASKSNQDVTCDLIVKFHILRLLGTNKSGAREKARIELESKIAHILDAHELERDVFEFIDRITAFCDSLAFDFCFEREKSNTLELLDKPGGSLVQVTYTVHSPTGSIQISPWPLKISSYQGFIIAHRAEGYPENIQPLIVAFNLRND
jgi:hypothetical protein